MPFRRRTFLKTVGLAAGLGLLPQVIPAVIPGTHNGTLRTRQIPSTGQVLPVIGLGTFVTFNFVHDETVLAQRGQLLQDFFSLGGGLVDSSPMYGASERNIGYALQQTGQPESLFSATKVWTSSLEDGPDEIEASRRLWGVPQFDLLQVHNLVAWEGHLEYLQAMKSQGRLAYTGVTTSHGRRHRELEKIMLSQPIDFVQATYNVIDREVEQRILPIAREKGIAFIANRPFQRGVLIDRVKQFPLPGFAAEVGCDNWACLLLKYIVSHPAVTCAIPATSRRDHLSENMSAMQGVLPDDSLRQQIWQHVRSL